MVCGAETEVGLSAVEAGGEGGNAPSVREKGNVSFLGNLSLDRFPYFIFARMEDTNYIREERAEVLALKEEGSPSSFAYLYERWSGKLYHFVWRISRGDRYLAEEIVQSVFIKVWEKRRELDADKSFGAFLCTLAKNRLINIYQHRMSEYLYLNEAEQRSAADNTTEKEVEYHLLDEYIRTLIDQLPPARREIFVLSRHHHLSNKEIAARLRLSENTVESQLTKAIAFLRLRILQHYKLSVSLLAGLFLS